MHESIRFDILMGQSASFRMWIYPHESAKLLQLHCSNFFFSELESLSLNMRMVCVLEWSPLPWRFSCICRQNQDINAIHASVYYLLLVCYELPPLHPSSRAWNVDWAQNMHIKIFNKIPMSCAWLFKHVFFWLLFFSF